MSAPIDLAAWWSSHWWRTLGLAPDDPLVSRAVDAYLENSRDAEAWWLLRATG